MTNTNEDLESKIEIKVEGNEIVFTIRTPKELLESGDEEALGVKTCCRIYDQDNDLLTCVGINEPNRILADAKCALKTYQIGGAGSRGYNNKGECGDFPECN